MYINSLLNINSKPLAFAKIKGNSNYPCLRGIVYFYNVEEMVLVSIQLTGLPTTTDVCKSPIFAVHIHSGDSCTGNTTDPFANAKTHYNPYNCAHPYHAGDLIPVFGVDGFGFSAFLTNRFTVNQIIGKTIIIHSSPDDFTSNPSGNSGTKIACGVIKCV